jgi:hypothetical protein
MPNRRPPATRANASPSPRGNFRRRYDELEAQRGELVARLRMLGELAKPHPGYKRALTLLNDTFRKSRLAQRLAILQAATWLIDVLEQITMQL